MPILQIARFSSPRGYSGSFPADTPQRRNAASSRGAYAREPLSATELSRHRMQNRNEKKGKRSADRRIQPCDIMRMPLRARRSTLASRRSTADSPAQSQPPLAQPQAAFPQDGLRGHYPRRLGLGLRRAPRRPVLVPDERDPGPPECGVTSPARGHRTCSTSGIVSRSALHGEQGDGDITISVTNVNRTVTTNCFSFNGRLRRRAHRRSQHRRQSLAHQRDHLCQHRRHGYGPRLSCTYPP
jgi:hypothetical protein